MQTILIELTNDKALKLLQDMEELNLIRLIPQKLSEQKLSERFSGKLDGTVAEEMQEYIKKSREEWDRNI